MKSMSITRRILSGVLLAELISGIIISLTSVAFERHIHFQAFDVMLHGRAESLLGAVADANDTADSVMLDTHSIAIPEGDLFEVQENNGLVLGSSRRWPAEITARNVETGSKNGIYRATVNHHEYRFVLLSAVRTVDPGEHGGTPHNITVLYGSPTTHVWHEIYEAARFYSILSLSLLIVTAGLIAWFLRSALSPLHRAQHRKPAAFRPASGRSIRPRRRGRHASLRRSPERSKRH